MLPANLVVHLQQPLLPVAMCQERVAGITGGVIGGLLGYWEVTRVRGSVEIRLPCEHHGQRQSASPPFVQDVPPSVADRSRGKGGTEAATAPRSPAQFADYMRRVNALASKVN